MATAGGATGQGEENNDDSESEGFSGLPMAAAAAAAMDFHDILAVAFNCWWFVVNLKLNGQTCAAHSYI